MDVDQRELLRSYRASRWQVFSLLEVPSALPVLLGGIKVGITGSIMGAVVGEFVGSDRGLGFLVKQYSGGDARAGTKAGLITQATPVEDMFTNEFVDEAGVE